MDAANSHLAVGDKWAVYNNPVRWSDPGIWKRPGFNVQKFQKRINKIIGTAAGRPIVRLVWAWDVDRFEAGEMRKAYKFFTATLPNGDTCDLSPPRWILEERIEPGQYMPNWEDVRYVKIPDGTEYRLEKTQVWIDEQGNVLQEPVTVEMLKAIPLFKTVDTLGPPPVDGMYSYLLLIADHDPDHGCCARAIRDWKEGRRATRRCWGYYRPPGDKDLQNLQRMKAERDATPYKQSPHEPLSAQTLSEIALLEQSWNEGVEQKRKTEAHALWADHVNLWGYRMVTDDPAVLSHGKYKFMPQRQFESKG